MMATLTDSTATPPRSFQALDCARLLAIISIVWLHTPESKLLERSVDLGRFAVPFFTFAALFLAFQSSLRHRESTIVSYFVSRFQRIYLVFVAWCVFYAAARLTRDLFFGLPLYRFSLLDFVWDGTAHHLWFLPFIFGASVLSFAIAKWTRALEKSYWLIVFACMLGSLALALNHAPYTFRDWGYTWELSVDALPSVLLAIAFAMTYPKSKSELFRHWLITLAAVLIWLACLAAVMVLGRNTLLETLSGLGLMLASLSASSSPLIARVAPLGKFSFGIYILHVLFLEGFQDILRRLAIAPSPQNDVATFLVTLLCCALTIFLMNKSAPARRLLL